MPCPDCGASAAFEPEHRLSWRRTGCPPQLEANRGPASAGVEPRPRLSWSRPVAKRHIGFPLLRFLLDAFPGHAVPFTRPNSPIAYAIAYACFVLTGHNVSPTALIHTSYSQAALSFLTACRSTAASAVRRNAPVRIVSCSFADQIPIRSALDAALPTPPALHRSPSDPHQIPIRSPSDPHQIPINCHIAPPPPLHMPPHHAASHRITSHHATSRRISPQVVVRQPQRGIWSAASTSRLWGLMAKTTTSADNTCGQHVLTTLAAHFC